jgi:hypothetical protein
VRGNINSRILEQNLKDNHSHIHVQQKLINIDLPDATDQFGCSFLGFLPASRTLKHHGEAMDMASTVRSSLSFIFGGTFIGSKLDEF